MEHCSSANARAPRPALLAGCGYHPAYEGQRPAVRLAVIAGAGRAPRPDALQAALAGARTELSRAGVLGQAGYPRLVLELVRVDESSSGIAAIAPDDPRARGSLVGVVARGWVEDAPGSARSRDTGDIRRVARFSAGAEVANDAMRYDEALRAAARDVGRAIARRVLGEPEPQIEAM